MMEFRVSKYTKALRRLMVDHVISRLSPSYQLNHNGQGAVNFIDVGSVGGLPEPWRQNANQVRFLLNFEPNEAPSRTANSMTYNTAVWECDTTLPFYIYKGFHQTGSSLLKQNHDYVDANFETLRSLGLPELAETWRDRSTLVRTAELRCRSLDTILQEALPDTPFHFLKIDAQGAEYHILKGAEHLLNTSCAGLHLELFTQPLYQDMHLLADVQALLTGHGFELVRKYPAHGSFDSQNDCVFLRPTADARVVSVIRKVYGLA